MAEVTCTHCGTAAAITPDDSLCPGCGEDLQHLLPTDAVVGYFRARVQEFWVSGDPTAALAETERGLTFTDSSDLHLMAAILAKQTGHFDHMRRHVAAIPVDDTLRSEAEWLLRSHQDRQRALREAARAQRGEQSTVAPPTADLLDDLLGRTVPTPVARRKPWVMVAYVLLVGVAATLIIGSWWWFGPGAIRRITPPRDQVSSGAVTPEPTATITPAPTALPTPAATSAAILPSPTPPAQVAATNSPRQVVLVTATPFDLAGFLRTAEQADLADLPITARLEEGRLILQGFVYLDAQRRRLLQLLQTVPDVREVVTTELLLRPLPTYVVQPGDTLWSIVYNIYGDVERLDEFRDFNADVLPAPDAILPGMELKVMPVQ